MTPQKFSFPVAQERETPSLKCETQSEGGVRLDGNAWADYQRKLAVMLKKNKLRLGVATAAAACALALTISATPAFADPSGYKTLSGVGSDTIQDVMNGMSSKVPAIGSYDAIDPATQTAGGLITTKSGGNSYVRPNGSGDGVAALSDSIEGGTHLWGTPGVQVLGQIDFARASSFQGSVGTDLTYIPFAQDSVTYAVNAGSDFPRNLALGSSADAATRLSLYNIYHCIKTSYLDSNGDSVTIHPLTPQSGSGTAKFWASTLGFNDKALPTCVKRVNTDATPAVVEEHNGTTLDDVGDIVPFSIAQYIAQGNHASIASAYSVNVNERRGNAILGSINGQPAVRESGTITVMNPSFPVTRQVFNVVSATRATSDSAIISTFVGGSSAVCSQSALIQAFGFSTISNCGDTTLQGAFTQ
jgi:ABC-type phosphate transport system substrate-binding protein